MEVDVTCADHVAACHKVATCRPSLTVGPAERRRCDELSPWTLRQNAGGSPNYSVWARSERTTNKTFVPEEMFGNVKTQAFVISINQSRIKLLCIDMGPAHRYIAQFIGSIRRLSVILKY